MNCADVYYNFNRGVYQQEIQKLINDEIITEEEIDKLVIKFMKDEIDKSDFIVENKIIFKKWIRCNDGGSSNALVLYDKCIIKILFLSINLM